MTWDSVPWFIEGGAEHSPQIARLLSYAAFGGREGIIGPRDLEVRALAAPAASVRVFPGACSITNRASGARYESYVGRLPIQHVVPISPTTAAGGRSDMIVALVKNPWLPGEPWDDPSDVRVGPYIDTVVISGVPSTARYVQVVRPGWSAIQLARIDIPASTTAITQAMITDLREVSQVRTSREMIIASPTSTTSITAADTWRDFPNDAACRLTVDVPDWATHAKVRAIVGGMGFGAAGANGGKGWSVAGHLRIQMGGATGATYSQTTAYNLSNDGSADRTTVMAGAPNIPIPLGDRGKSTTIRLEGRKNAGGNTNPFIDSSSMVTLEVDWVQSPESNL